MHVIQGNGLLYICRRSGCGCLGNLRLHPQHSCDALTGGECRLNLSELLRKLQDGFETAARILGERNQHTECGPPGEYTAATTDRNAHTGSNRCDCGDDYRACSDEYACDPGSDECQSCTDICDEYAATAAHCHPDHTAAGTNHIWLVLHEAQHAVDAVYKFNDHCEMGHGDFPELYGNPDVRAGGEPGYPWGDDCWYPEDYPEGYGERFEAEVTERLDGITEPVKEALGAQIDYFEGAEQSRSY